MSGLSIIKSISYIKATATTTRGDKSRCCCWCTSLQTLLVALVQATADDKYVEQHHCNACCDANKQHARCATQRCLTGGWRSTAQRGSRLWGWRRFCKWWRCTYPMYIHVLGGVFDVVARHNTIPIKCSVEGKRDHWLSEENALGATLNEEIDQPVYFIVSRMTINAKWLCAHKSINQEETAGALASAAEVYFGAYLWSGHASNPAGKSSGPNRSTTSPKTDTAYSYAVRRWSVCDCWATRQYIYTARGLPCCNER